MTRTTSCLIVICQLVFGAAPKKRQTFDLAVGGLASGSLMPAAFTRDASGDADARDFVHWLLWDIPASVHSLESGAKDIGVKAGKGRDALEQAMRKHVVAKAEYRLGYGH